MKYEYKNKKKRLLRQKLHELSYVCIYTSLNVHELRSIGILRQEKAIRLNGTANDGHSDAPELLVVGVPRLDHTGFRLDAIVGFKGIKTVQLALVELSLLLPLSMS